MSNARRGRGRPSAVHDIKEVEGIIKKYIDENPDKDIIKPYALAKYHFVEEEMNQVKERYATSFWRSQGQFGREMIDKWNSVLAETRKGVMKENQGFYHTDSLVQSGNGKLSATIFKKLKLNESRGKYLSEKLDEKEKMYKELEGKFEDLNSRYRQALEQNERLEVLLFDITLASSYKRSKMENLIDLNGERSPMVESILKYSLGDLESDRFDLWLRGKSEEVNKKENLNIVSFPDNKNTSAFDDFSF